MNWLTTPGVQHLIAGLATIGALAALAATGAVPGNDALVPIVAIGSALVGGGIATSSASQAVAQIPTPPPPASISIPQMQSGVSVPPAAPSVAVPPVAA